jgi:hypothetical protein
VISLVSLFYRGRDFGRSSKCCQRVENLISISKPPLPLALLQCRVDLVFADPSLCECFDLHAIDVWVFGENGSDDISRRLLDECFWQFSASESLPRLELQCKISPCRGRSPETGHSDVTQVRTVPMIGNERFSLEN